MQYRSPPLTCTTQRTRGKMNRVRNSNIDIPGENENIDTKTAAQTAHVIPQTTALAFSALQSTGRRDQGLRALTRKSVLRPNLSSTGKQPLADAAANSGDLR